MSPMGRSHSEDFPYEKVQEIITDLITEGRIEADDECTPDCNMFSDGDMRHAALHHIKTDWDIVVPLIRERLGRLGFYDRWWDAGS